MNGVFTAAARTLTAGEMQTIYFFIPIGGLTGLYALTYYFREKKGFSEIKSRMTAFAVVFAVIIAIAAVIRLIFGRQPYMPL